MDYAFVSVNGMPVKLRVWDTAGQERLANLTSSFLKNLNGVMLVFDMTDKKSFENTLYWYKQINECSSIPVILLGNKGDNKTKRVVDRNSIQEMSRKFKFTPFETSAYSGQNVEQAFNCLVYKIFEPTLI